MKQNNETSMLDQLPQEFQDFLKEEGINPNIFNMKQTKRYIRMKPSSKVKEVELRELFPELEKILWLDDVYSIPIDNKINDCPLYQQGLLYGIDLASIAVVQAMDINKDDFQVLEICCAPGAKLSYIADITQQFPNKDQRHVTGVDINQNRLNVTKAIIQKYGLEKTVTLVQADGTIYKPSILFDKILIDAECTHEGSVKHLGKYFNRQTQDVKVQKKKLSRKQEKQSMKQLKKNHSNDYISQFDKKNQWTKEDFINRFLDPFKLKVITELQYNLLENGFSLLKEEGVLIYSTCSFSQRQNEDIISKFTQEHLEQVELLNPFDHLPLEKVKLIPFKDGNIKNTIRFDPIVSNSGGMFIAKLKKLKKQK